MGRRGVHRLTALAVLGAVLAVVPPAQATHGVGHPDWSCCPALRSFAADFPVLLDDEWGYELGGWGGIAAGAPLAHTPVIFVHGNSADASFWDLQNESGLAVNVRQRFRDAGYTDQELWALSYNGAGCNNNTCQTSNDVNVPDLERFVRAVLAYTGAARVDIVAHSLGVTIARKMMFEHPDLAARVEDAVFASGANHGTTACRGSENIIGCHEIYPGSPWLAELNADETPGETRYVTVCDCTGAADHFFLGPDARSPQLDGARNLEFPGSAHFVTARGPEVVPVYLPLVARGTTHTPAARPRLRVKDAATSREPLPATGAGTGEAAALVLAAAAAGAALLRRRPA